MRKSNYQSDFELLRQKAEELLKKKKIGTDSSHAEADVLKLIHELEVHQIELKLQNEELVLAKSEAQQAAEKYVELYDFAPTGYFTLDKEGKITKTNFAGAKMFDKSRSELINRHFAGFILNDAKPIFNQFLQKVFESETKEHCEITLTTDDNSSIWLHLSGVVTEDRGQCQVNALDITDRKQAEMTAIYGRKILRTLIDNLPDLIYFKDIECRKVIANFADVQKYWLSKRRRDSWKDRP